MSNTLPLWLVGIGWITKLILVLLIGLSVWSVSIMWDRKKVFEKTKSKNLFKGAEKAMEEVSKNSHENLDRAYKSYISLEKTKLENGFTALATLASNAPFIGLFGTVLGIIQAFGALAVMKSDSTQIMASISEALVATAIGLLVAIPAGIAYNIFLRKLKVIMQECESLRDEYISKVK